MSNRELVILLIDYLLEKHNSTDINSNYRSKANTDADLDFFDEKLPNPKPSQESFSYSEFSIFPNKEVKHKQNTKESISDDFADFDFDSF